jgi:fatty acid desaturase
MAAPPAALADSSAADYDRSFEYCAPTDGPQWSGAYRDLKNLIERAGLFERQYGFYARIVLVAWAMLAIGFGLLPVARDQGWYVVDAVFLSLAYVQLAYLGHDGAHGEVFRAWRNNYLFCLVQGNLLLGLSTSWWTRKHNRHHSNPNCAGLDGEIEIAGLAFTKEIALDRVGWMRTAAKWQAYTFFPLLSLTALALRIESAQFIATGNVRHRRAEALLALTHFAVYGWFVFSVLGASRGIVFVLVHQVLFGLYMGLVFAPNHKGMPMIDKGVRLDFLQRQVMTARNITPGRITDWLFGGLNYQIEHHLFPSIPRNRLNRARAIVKPFCQERGIPYAETGPFRSYLEILTYLDEIGEAVRRAPAVTRRSGGA